MTFDYNLDETENTKSAVDKLRKYTNKIIIIRDVKEFSNHLFLSGATSYLGVTKEDEKEIFVWLNFTYPDNIIEAIFVHEILHILLKNEGFPEVMINNNTARNLPSEMKSGLQKLQPVFSSAITHPEIYHRMYNEFDLNLDPYFEIEVKQKISRFQKGKEPTIKNGEYYFYRQQDILAGLDYFLYGKDYSNKILDIFKSYHRNAYDSCIYLNRRVNRIGLNNPRAVYKSAQFIKEYMIKYGNKRSIGIYNELWKALDIII